MNGSLSQKPSKRWSNLIGVVVALLVLASLGMVFRPRSRLLPAKTSVTEPAQMGDVVRVHLPFVNRTWRTLRLTGFTRSCGCTDAVRIDESPIHYPVTVGPGETFSAMLNIHTAGRPIGLLSVSAGYKTDDAQYPLAQSQVDVEVRAGWCPSATVIQFNKGRTQESSGEVLVGDTYPGVGIEVESVRSTSPRFQAGFERCDVQPHGVATIPHWTPRYRVFVRDLGGDSNNGPIPYVWIYRKDGKDPMRLAIIAPLTVANRGAEPIPVFVPCLGADETCKRFVRLPGLAELSSLVAVDGPIKPTIEEVLMSEGDALVRLGFRGPLTPSTKTTALTLRALGGTTERTIELAINVAEQ